MTARRAAALTVALLATTLVAPTAGARSGPTCQGLLATIVGTPGSDTIVGTLGDDVIVGRGGRDIINGRAGEDVICGGRGADEIDGGPGDDVLVGGPGPDVLDGGGGSDHLIGGQGADTLRGGRAGDLLAGGANGDLLQGGAGPDTIHGGGGNDRLEGGPGRDKLDGGQGRDDLAGVTESDKVLDEAQLDSGADRLVYDKLTLVLRGDATASFDGIPFDGPLEVRTAPDGLVIVERTNPQDYLLGVDEMPFSWSMPALKAQVIAARTYLANLVTFPYGAQATYGFDICDSTSCQVYRGALPSQREDFDRWQRAVEQTDGRILIAGGVPAAALYHSTSGTTTRSIEDVWEGRSPVSYLTAVDVPEQDSPFASWSYQLPLDAFLEIMAAAGHDFGGDEVTRIRSKKTDPGGGPYLMKVFTDSGRTDLPMNTVQLAINVHGPSLYPDLLPAYRTDGSGFRYPQAALSPTMTVVTDTEGNAIVSGEGWGHQLGLSQYGAEAMGRLGSSPREILEHFYSGLTPVNDPGFLPDEILVGLGWERSAVNLPTTGRWILRAPEGVVARGSQGTISLSPHDGEVVFHP
jgi:SpoIID/LytB domain protein